MSIKKIIMQCLKYLVRIAATPLDTYRLSKMSQSDDIAVANFAKVLRLSFSRKPDSAGVENIRHIEEHRQRLLACNTVLPNSSTVSLSCQASKAFHRALSLYFLVRQFSPVSCLELGTCVGISAAYQAAALSANQNNGHLITMERSGPRIEVARDMHNQLGFDNVSYVQGRFKDTLPSTLEGADAFDYAFIDGHHQYEPTLHYFDLIFEHCSENAVVIFDDIRWSSGMRKAWKQLRLDRRFSIVIDMYTFGICQIAKPNSQNLPQFFGPFFQLL